MTVVPCAAARSGAISATISAGAISTTLRVLENGALKTATPCSDAAGRSIWFVPMQKAPTASSRGAAASTFAVTRVVERIPSKPTPATRSARSASPSAPAATSTR